MDSIYKQKGFPEPEFRVWDIVCVKTNSDLMTWSIVYIYYSRDNACWKYVLHSWNSYKVEQLEYMWTLQAYTLQERYKTASVEQVQQEVPVAQQ